MTRSGEEKGQITVITVGFLVVLGLLVVVVVNSSAAFLERQRLNALADGAALAAADGLQSDAFYGAGVVLLDPAAARRMAADHVGREGGDVDLLEVTFPDDETVRIRVERVVDLTLVPPGWTRTTRVTAEATASLVPSQ